MDGWRPADRMLAPGAPDLDHWMKAIAERLGGGSRALCASLLLERYAHALGLAAFDGLARRRVPDLAAANVALRLDGEGQVGGVGLRAARFAPPGGDQRALLAWLSGRLVDGHLALLVARVGERRVRRGPRALWGLVANGCAAAIAETAGEPRWAAALAAGFFGRGGWPLPAPRLLALPHQGQVRLLRTRVTCCLWYTVDRPCATCPLLGDQQRLRRAAATAAPEGCRRLGDLRILRPTELC